MGFWKYIKEKKTSVVGDYPMKERGDNMRILVISDSHGQLGNLNEILKEGG